MEILVYGIYKCIYLVSNADKLDYFSLVLAFSKYNLPNEK